MTRALRLLRDGRGAAALEFALVGLPLIMLILGLIEFGRALYVKSALDSAADRAQRMVLIDPSATDAAIDAQIEHFLEDLSADRLTVTHGTEAQSGSDYRLVMLNYDMNLVIPTLVGATVSIGAVSRILLH